MKKYIPKEENIQSPNSKPASHQQKHYIEKKQSQETDNNHKTHKTDTKSKKQYHNKKNQHYRSKYNWNRKDVTEDTPIPPLPANQLPKPDKDKFHQQLNTLIKKIDQQSTKKNNLINKLTTTLKTTSQLKQKFSPQLKQKLAKKRSINQQINILKQQKQKIIKQKKQIKIKIHSIKHSQLQSLQSLTYQLSQQEHRLITAQLTKKQQNQVNNKIVQLRRAIQQAKSKIQLDADRTRLEDQEDIVWGQIEEINQDLKEKYDELGEIKSEIEKIREEEKIEKGEKPEDNRTHDEIKADYNRQIQKVNQQKLAIKDQITHLKSTFNKSCDQYQQYSQLLSYIKLVTQQKQKIKQYKHAQQQKKLQEQQQEKRRQNEEKQRQRKRKQKQEKDLQRKKEKQQKYRKLQKQKQLLINQNPYQNKIDSCKLLIQYCQSLKPQSPDKKQQKRQQKINQPIIQLTSTNSKDWQKQLSKGAQVLISKKQKQQEDIPKKLGKQKKNKNKQINQNLQVLLHSNHIVELFTEIKILPPIHINQIQQIVQEINQKLTIFNKPTQEQIIAYKQKTSKQFDAKHGINYQGEGKKVYYKQKNGTVTNDVPHDEHQEIQEKTKNKKWEKKDKVAHDQDFPELR